MTRVALLLVCLTSPVFSQGCTQCRDNTAATPIETQHAYRSAILLLAGGALGVGSAALYIGRRFR